MSRRVIYGVDKWQTPHAGVSRLRDRTRLTGTLCFIFMFLWPCRLVVPAGCDGYAVIKLWFTMRKPMVY